MESTASHDTALIEFLAWVEIHKKKLIIGTAAVAVIALGWSINSWSRDQKELSASQALLALRPAPVPAGATPPVISADSYLQIVARFPKTAASRHALLLAASQLFVEDKFAEAQKQFEAFMASSPDSPLAPQAMLGIAACLDAQKKTADAAKKYEEVYLRFANDAVAPQAKLSLARIWETENKLPQAYRLYDELSPKAPQEMMRPRWYSAQAMARMGKLLEGHPELARTNAPPVPASTNTLSLKP